MALLECKNLSKSFGSVAALDDISLKIESGRIVGLLGPNGSGKTTLIKLACGLLTPTGGKLLINGRPVGIESKKEIAFLPERTYLNFDMKVSALVTYFSEFYENFDPECAYRMLKQLDINPKDRLKTMSKGTKEKVQLILVMSRKAQLYILDEPIGGIDPAARDYILDTVLTNFNPGASILISTHLISDIERILDDVIFINKGKVILTSEADSIRTEKGKSIDAIFREVFKC